MLENDEKGSYGAYSSAGKNSVELFTNVRKKDSILNPQSNSKNKTSIINFLKRNGYHNIHGDDTELKRRLMDELDDSILKDYEINRVPANSETNSKAYSWYEGNDETEEEGLEEEYING